MVGPTAANAGMAYAEMSKRGIIRITRLFMGVSQIFKSGADRISEFSTPDGKV